MKHRLWFIALVLKWVGDSIVQFLFFFSTIYVLRFTWELVDLFFFFSASTACATFVDAYLGRNRGRAALALQEMATPRDSTFRTPNTPRPSSLQSTKSLYNPDMSRISASSPRVLGLFALLFLASCLMTLSLRSNPRTPSYHRNQAGSRGQHNQRPMTGPNVAFVTFLGAFTGGIDPNKPEDDNDDGYYLSTRVLGYQLMHSPTAGTNSSIPFVVIVTDETSARKRARLEKDGATVIQVERISPGWAIPGDPRWKDMMTKLRLFELTQYAKICYIDSDHLVVDRLDGIFWDEATLTQHTFQNPNALADDEAALPRTYMMAAHADFWGYDHPYPPPADGDYMNFGFAVFSPSKPLFEYYLSVLAIQGRFDMVFQEQSLVNYAHRRGGNMPWKPLWHGWNVNWPTERDWKGGAKSFHAKYWDTDPSHDKVLKQIWREQRAEMEGFYRGRDGGA